MIKFRIFINTSVIILSLLLQSQTSFGQDKRICDISARLLSPTDGFTIRSPGRDSCEVQLTNLGPDTILPLDMYAITIQFGGARQLPLVREYGLTLLPGDSISITVHFKLIGTNDADDISFCIYSVTSYTPPNARYTPLLLERDSAILLENNTDCVTGFHRMKNSSVDEIPNDNLVIYPNPSSTEITISYPNYDRNACLKILDMAGKTVLYVFNLPIDNAIDISMLSTGLYVVKVESSNRIMTGLIVKN